MNEPTASRNPAYHVGEAIAILQEIAGGHPLPQLVSQQMGSAQALATMMRISHQPQHALAQVAKQVGLPTRWAHLPGPGRANETAAWLGYYHRQAALQAATPEKEAES